MRGGRAFEAAVIAAGLVVVVYVIDGVAGSALNSTVAGVCRAVVIVGAVICAGVLYQLWSVRKPNDVADHAAVAAALLGGALVASSAFSAPSSQVFGNGLTAALGVAGLLLGLAGARPTRIRTEGRQP
jgi:peptidoglycan/LPS O-acetylase OafA/YrhL